MTLRILDFNFKFWIEQNSQSKISNPKLFDPKKGSFQALISKQHSSPNLNSKLNISFLSAIVVLKATLYCV
ncbi:hypothetical protein CLI64_00865 [Nostoc sp. CENA543]|nr:hypothetical protein CLI64_00865 [Nostoc sp. CENA543]